MFNNTCLLIKIEVFGITSLDWRKPFIKQALVIFVHTKSGMFCSTGPWQRQNFIISFESDTTGPYETNYLNFLFTFKENYSSLFSLWMGMFW